MLKLVIPWQLPCPAQHRHPRDPVEAKAHVLFVQNGWLQGDGRSQAFQGLASDISSTCSIEKTWDFVWDYCGRYFLRDNSSYVDAFDIF